MRLLLEEYLLELKHPFTISRTSRKTQPTLIVRLVEDSYTGLGEATSNPYYKITVKKMKIDLTNIQTIIESNSNLNPNDFWSKMYPYLKDNMFALCALDVAYNDLYAKKKQKKLFDFWGFNPSNNPLTNFTIGIDTIDNMIQKLNETPWPIYKVKLGTKNDINIIKALRNHTKAIFRVDANCGWTVEETLKNAIELKKLGVEFIEQPLAADNWEGHKVLYKKSVLPIIADESCQVETDIEKCHNHFHGVNIKLMKCGGITPGKRMLGKSIKLGLKTMVGCMTESSVGIAAIAHLLPLLDYVDMDGALLLKTDIAQGVIIENGKISYSEKNGTGAKLI